MIIILIKYNDILVFSRFISKYMFLCLSGSGSFIPASSRVSVSSRSERARRSCHSHVTDGRTAEPRLLRYECLTRRLGEPHCLFLTILLCFLYEFNSKVCTAFHNKYIPNIFYVIIPTIRINLNCTIN